MIKRHYFFSAEKPYDDSLSFHHVDGSVFHRSWFPRSDFVLDKLMKDLKESLKNSPGNGIKLLAFNRI